MAQVRAGLVGYQAGNRTSLITPVVRIPLLPCRVPSCFFAMI